jgi:hypothetical protein
MKTFSLSVVTLAFVAASAGCAWTVNVALYRLWPLLTPAVFAVYQAEHARLFVPLAALLGLPSVVLALLMAWRGVPALPRWVLWAGAALALLPWLATPVYFLPLQHQLSVAGPTPALVGQLVAADLALRTVPPTLHLGIVLWALLASARQERRAATAAPTRLQPERDLSN